MVELLSAVSPTSTSTSMEDHPPSQTLVNSSLNHVVDEVLVLPQEEEIEDFDHQIAGHVSEKVRRYRQHFILKPQVKKDLFTRETLFYEEIFSTQLQQQLLLEEEGEGEEGEGEGEKKSETRRQKKIIEGLRECLPVFHGVVFIPNPTCPPTTTSTTTSFGIPTTNLLPCLCLQDLTQGYTIPCLIDIKMGQQTYEPTASRDKINREQGKYPYQHTIGFRITGLKVWDHMKHCYHTLGKHFGRSLLPHEVIYGLAFFFNDGYSSSNTTTTTTVRKEIIQEIIQLLKTIKDSSMIV
eukprot:gene10998-12245_t